MRSLLFSIILISLFFSSCRSKPEVKQQATNNYTPKPYVEIRHPEWTKNATIYEVNVRQYTPEGTFKAFASHLQRLKEMGVQTLWFMPINPISLKDRKGVMGSYYAVADYTAINSEFGTLTDFIHLVNYAHS